jgi:uncharacterized protein YgiM (DUF1202 family)
MFRLLKVLVSLAALAAVHMAVAQPSTATPAPLQLPTDAPQIEEIAGATATWTPTPEGQVMVEAIDFVNVRTDPDTNSAALGQIRAGDLYPATARNFEWIQIQFDAARRGWVYSDLVNVTGSLESLPDLVEAPVTSEVTEELSGENALAVITLTPGGLLTATAGARLNAGTGGLPASTGEVLPTFTYPPGVAVGAPVVTDTNSEPTADNAPVVANPSGDMPPIVPILALGGLGILGLALSSLRR